MLNSGSRRALASIFERIEQHVEALNASLSASRLTAFACICAGASTKGRNIRMCLEKILLIAMEAKPQALLCETSNPRHAQDWAVIREMKHVIPDDKIATETLAPSQYSGADELATAN